MHANVPHLPIVVVAILEADGIHGSCNALLTGLRVKTSIGIMIDDSSEENLIVLGVVSVIQDVLMPHLVNWKCG